jgi:hypothetical protein
MLHFGLEYAFLRVTLEQRTKNQKINGNVWVKTPHKNRRKERR